MWPVFQILQFDSSPSIHTSKNSRSRSIRIRPVSSETVRTRRTAAGWGGGTWEAAPDRRRLWGWHVRGRVASRNGGFRRNGRLWLWFGLFKRQVEEGAHVF